MMLPDAPATDSATPENGVRGPKHWRYDLMTGLQVALVGLPLSLGIAVASGAPPVTGVISAIIGGLVYPFLGGSYVTISEPAAGLAPALLAGILSLGLLIIIKMVPALVGDVAPPATSIPAAVGQIRDNILHLTPTAFIVEAVSLILLFSFSKRTDRWSTLFPPPSSSPVQGSSWNGCFNFRRPT